ncbi:MAG: DUF6108 family protein, partial [Prevotellaceae bacterium]|nr:DUF6108 family protein [Prevotellaceae bacterium]
MKQLILCAMLIAALPARAQKDLQVSDVFDAYKKDKNMVLVELSGELLKEYKYERFRSLTVRDNAPAIAHIRSCLAADQQRA